MSDTTISSALTIADELWAGKTNSARICAAISALRSQQARIEELEANESDLLMLLALEQAECRDLKERIAELEAQLSAIGAGGVESLCKRDAGYSDIVSDGGMDPRGRQAPAQEHATKLAGQGQDMQQDRLDAERYRWFAPRLMAADFDWNETGKCALIFEWPANVGFGGNCDQHIDAAMAAQQEGGKA